MPHGSLADARRILCVGAHADDIEIGCGGTILALLSGATPRHVDWVVLSAEGRRADEALDSADAFLKGAASTSLDVQAFRERYFPHLVKLKEYFDDMQHRLAPPDVVFVPSLHDRHQDHRTVAELAWNSFRSSLVLEYEIPKYEGDLQTPNAYVPLDDETAHRKLDLLMEAFPSQQIRPWWSRETFEGLLRLRGMESPARSGFAEGHHCRKLLLSTDH